MAIEVIGKNPAMYREATCRNCASNLRYVGADVQERIHRDYLGEADTIYYIVCPCCNKEVPARKY